MKLLAISASLLISFGCASALGAADCIPALPVNCPLLEGVGDGSRVYEVAGCSASVQANWDGFSGKTNVAQCEAIAPLGTTLVSYKVASESYDNGTKSISRFTAGTDLDYESEILQDFSDAIEIAAKKGDTVYEGKLKSARDLYQKYMVKLKTNMDGVRVEVSAQTQGSVIDRKGGHADVSVNLLVVCSHPLNAREQISRKYHVVFKEMVQPPTKIAIFRNSTSQDAFLGLNIGSSDVPCDDGSRRTANYSVLRGQRTEVSLLDGQNACWLWGNQTPHRSSTQQFCTAEIGDDNDLATRADCFVPDAA